jgi:hypothetical protein
MPGVFSRNAKTAVISAAVAAATAAVMAGAPALARTTVARAAPSPVIVSGFKNGPVLVTGSGLKTIATMHVPSGHWAISGKAWALNLGSVFLEVDCRLVAGTSSDSSRPVVGPNGQNVSAATLAFNVIHTFKTAGTVTVRCNSFGVSLQVNQIKITAIKAGKLTNSKLS